MDGGRRSWMAITKEKIKLFLSRNPRQNAGGDKSPFHLSGLRESSAGQKRVESIGVTLDSEDKS